MRKERLGLATVILLLVFVATAAAQGAGQGRAAGPPSRFPPDQGPQIFPTGAFPPNHERLTRVYAWYLRAMGERPLGELATSRDAEAYRLLVLPAFRSPIVVRLAFTPSGPGKLTVKLGETELKPEPLLADKQREVLRPEVDHFSKLIRRLDFWSMPAWPSKRVVRMGGATWLLEGIRGRTYHAVDQTEPLPTRLQEAEEYLLSALGGIRIDSLPRHFDGPDHSQSSDN